MASESPRRWLTRAAGEKGGAGGGPADPDGPQQAARDWLASGATQGAACHAHCSCTASSPAGTKTGGRAARKAVQKGLLGRPGPRAEGRGETQVTACRGKRRGAPHLPADRAHPGEGAPGHHTLANRRQ